jgi:valyl-tRNA synthetase
MIKTIPIRNIQKMSEISKVYNPKEVEAHRSKQWEQSGAFSATIHKSTEAYSIMIPPPNVTGMLHMGHVLDNTLQDIFIRRARLEGHSVLWQPGTDHAGIATQTKVEKQLKSSEGLSKHDLGREAFVKKIWEFREESGEIILKQLQKLGASCDWSRTRFTLDEDYSSAVLQAFVTLYKRGYVYRGNRMVNWCPATQTAISDEEVIMKAQQGVLYKMRYELVEPEDKRTHLEIATTRPETIMGDTAVAVHPEDERYKHLIGKMIWRPYPKAKIPIIGDAYVDRDFGTGCLKVTPAHDKNDFEIGQRHNLECIEVIDARGILNKQAGPAFEGLERFEARKQVAKQLEADGLLIERESYENVVGYSERGDVPIEPRLSEQWFLKYPKVEEAKRAVEAGIIKFYPDRWKKTYLHWLNGIQDWCISRQLWWGHRIPVWYKKGIAKEALDYSNPDHVYVGVEAPKDSHEWEQDPDVLDTWASSYLWPMVNLGWPNPSELQKKEMDFWYPTTTLVTGFDIIFFWVARMIMAGLELFGEEKESLSDEEIAQRIPFRNIYIHGLIRDEKGRKMSKSLGNSPDPLELIEKFGADGLRFGICNIAPTGSDILFSEERIQIGRNFCNKLWNAARFRQMSGSMQDNSSDQAIIKRMNIQEWDDYDHWILAQLQGLTESIEDCFKQFDLAPLTHLIYKFFWNDFCDWYVEASKGKLGTDGSEKENCLAIQDFILRQVLQLAHPVIPHITEELWRLLGYGNKDLLIEKARILSSATIREQLAFDERVVERVNAMQSLITEARALKAQYKMANKRDLTLYYSHESTAKQMIVENQYRIQTLAGFKEIKAVLESETEGMVAAATSLGSIYLDLSEGIDVEAEKIRLSKELERLNQLVSLGEKKLENPKFVNSAPEKVVEGAKKQLEATRIKRDDTQRIFNSLS